MPTLDYAVEMPQGAGNSALFFCTCYPVFCNAFAALLQFNRAFLPLNLFAHRKKANVGSVAVVSAKATKLGFYADQSLME